MFRLGPSLWIPTIGRRDSAAMSLSRGMATRTISLLRELHEPALKEEELIGVRLYTGPMFEKYNAVLRGGALNAKQAFRMKEQFKKRCKGSQGPD